MPFSRNRYTSPIVQLESITVHSEFDAEMLVTPNPSSSGKFKLEISGLGEEKILQVLNVQGKILIEQPLSADVAAIDLSSFGTGTYFVNVSDGVSVTTETIIFQ